MSEASEAAPAAAPAVRLAGLRKVFGTGAGSVVAVDSVDLDVGDGEFFAMLGPSGSGKTTVLRMIAGFETPTAGRIHLGGRDVTTDPPFDRDVNTVFQDYALFPHMSVLDNVAYGLMVKGVGKSARRSQAREALATMRLAGMDDRRPGQLSGGQRQRVALARALVNHPKVLLLDEPLGALDLKLREQMQLELKSIQREVGVTFLFVTHDQEEALTMSDRIAVFNEGQVEQVGTPSRGLREPRHAVRRGLRRHVEPHRRRRRAHPARRGRHVQRPSGEDRAAPRCAVRRRRPDMSSPTARCTRSSTPDRRRGTSSGWTPGRSSWPCSRTPEPRRTARQPPGAAGSGWALRGRASTAYGAQPERKG